MTTNGKTVEKRSGGGTFNFIKSRGSLRKEVKRQHSRNDGEGPFGRLLRELRPSSRDSSSSSPRAPLNNAVNGPAPAHHAAPSPAHHAHAPTHHASAPAPLDRKNPIYHSEGKGLRKRKERDKRRHSFNEQQPEYVRQPRHHSRSSNPHGTKLMARDAAPSERVMMPAHTTAAQSTSIYSYLHSQSGLNFAPVVRGSPPVRDAASLKNIKYGPGHEKYPSWPVPAEPSSAGSGGGSHRSKSWTDHTNYPKEKGIPYTKPYMKRANPQFTRQLKTVMERCEKITLETFEPRPDILENSHSHLYLPQVDREGKILGDNEYVVPSPPERDLSMKPHLTQADLEEYARTYHELVESSVKQQHTRLTRAELEEYSRSYDDGLQPMHQQQPSYAQSEGYHSYVSSTDSTTTTPFLDRLRQSSEAPGPQVAWEERGRDSVVTTSSGSASSSETLKWHGSLSDVSVASSSCAQPSSRQLIAHSSRVQTPQKHNSESVLYLDRVNRNKLRLFPVSTYTVQPEEQQGQRSVPVSSPTQPVLSVAERVCELEKQQLQTRYTYLDPEKRHRVSDPTLKAIQKKALLSYYERHQQSWRSEPHLAPPQPPPRPRPPPSSTASSRRASSASDYASGSKKESLKGRESNGNSEISSPSGRESRRHHHSCGSLSSDLLGPLIVGPSISVDDWVPERPPKKPHLRATRPPPPIPDRLPSPDLPPPSPPPVFEEEVFASDEPLPPPPPELRTGSGESVYQNHIITSDARVSKEKSVVSPGSVGKPTTPSKTKENTMKSPSKENHEFSNIREKTSPKTDERQFVISNMLQKCESSNEAMQRFTESNILTHKNKKTVSSPLSSPTKTVIMPNNEANSILPNYADSENVPSKPSRPQSLNILGSNKESSSSIMKQFHSENENKPRDNILNANNRQPKCNNSNSESQPKQRTSNFIQKSLDSVSTSQRCLENRTSGLFENSFSSQKLNGESHAPSQRYQQWDINQKNVCNSYYRTTENIDKVSQDVIKQKPAAESALLSKCDNNKPRSPVNSECKNSTPQDIFHKVESKSVDLISNKQYIESCFPVELETSHPDVNSKLHATENMHSSNNKNNSVIANNRHFNNYFPRSFSLKHIDHVGTENIPTLSFAQPSDCVPTSTQNSTQRLIVNGKVATSLREFTPQVANSYESMACSCAKSKSVTLPNRCHVSKVSDMLPNFENTRLSLPPSSGATRSSPPRRCSLEQEQLRRGCEAHHVPNTHHVWTSHGYCNNDQSSSKASYLATSYKRDKDLPNFEGSYKRTMSPSESYKPIECDPVPSECRVVQDQPDPSHHFQALCPERTDASPVENGGIIRNNTSKSVEDLVHHTDTLCSNAESYENGDSGVELSASCSEVETQCDLSNSSHSVAAPCDSPPLPPPPSPPAESPPHVTEGLQFVQRSEIVLRVNAATTDASSQTETEREATASPPAPILVRQKLQEEIECERLSLDLASHLPPTDKLQGILVQGPDHKKTTDYVSGLFRLDIPARPRGKTVMLPKTETADTDYSACNGLASPSHKESEIMTSVSSNSSLSPNSAYFTTSESKAKFLTRYSSDVGRTEQLETVEDGRDLHKKKEELVNRLGRKLDVLREEHALVAEESQVNDELGESVSSLVSRVAHPQELAKYKLHVEEVGKITSLLLGLSGRLARAENALLGLPELHSERKILESKRDKLKEQLEEAKKLKENIDRRSVCVSNILCKYFSEEQYADYDHFINMKAKLIVDSREIADKIKLGEEQLAALKETLTKPD